MGGKCRGGKFDAAPPFRAMPDGDMSFTKYDGIVLFGEPDDMVGDADGLIQAIADLQPENRPSVVVYGHPFTTEDSVKQAVDAGMFAGQVISMGNGDDICETLRLLADALVLKSQEIDPRSL